MGTVLMPLSIKLRDKDRGTLGVNMNLLTDRLLICFRREIEQMASWKARILVFELSHDSRHMRGASCFLCQRL